MFVFDERRKPGYLEKNLSKQEKKKTNNKLNLNITLGPGIERWPQWWEARLSPLRHSCSPEKKNTMLIHLARFRRLSFPMDCFCRSTKSVVPSVSLVWHLQDAQIGCSDCLWYFVAWFKVSLAFGLFVSLATQSYFCHGWKLHYVVFLSSTKFVYVNRLTSVPKYGLLIATNEIVFATEIRLSRFKVIFATVLLWRANRWGVVFVHGTHPEDPNVM